jgi:hypothetical protein
MDRLEILKKAKEKVDALVAEKFSAQQEDQLDSEASDLALKMQMHDDLVTAIEGSKIDLEDFRRIFDETVSKIDVKVPAITVPPIIIPEIKVPEAKVTVTIPEIKLPTINVPEPKVTVNVPEVKIPPFPEIQMPESMEIHGDVGLFGYGFDNPLPVQLRDANGKPFNLNDLVGNSVSAGGPRSVKINNRSDEPIPISGTISATFSADFGSAEVGAQTLRVVQATDAISSVNIVGGSISSTPGATYYASDAVGSMNIVQSIPLDVTVIGVNGTIGVVTINPDGNPVYGGSGTGSSVSVTDIFGTVGTNVVNPDGRLKVELPSGATGLTDTELRASHLDVQQVSGAIDSVNVLTMPSVTVTSITNSLAVSHLGGDGQTIDPRNRTWTITETVPVSSSNTLDVQQVSGASWSTNVLSMPAVVVTSITNSTASTLLNGDGTTRDTWGASQVGTWNVATVTGITNSLASALVDSTGAQYSGSNPVPVLLGFSAVTATTVDATASGDNTIVSITNTPRLYYIALSANGANSADVTAIVKIGASSKFKVSLKAGSIWAHHIGASSQFLTGSAGDDIVVNLSGVQTVHCSVEYADV